tara:strand:- start:8485 stop:9489 length:1005 start_codon:yes stop_codon:yes gene_type:complete
MKVPQYPTLLAIVAGSLITTSSSASLLVYEGFNYGESSMNIDGVSVGGGATGLTGSYSTSTGTSGNGNVQTSIYNSSGLTFSNLSTTGGALTQTVSPTIDSTKEYTYSHAAINTSGTGTIYNSMLVRVDSNALSNPTLGQNPSNSGVSDMRIQSTSSLTGNGNGSMVTNAKRSNQGSQKPGTSYTANGFIGGSGTISLAETYLFITKYTNVGGVDGGDATLWVFDETGFDTWQANGGLEGDLSTYAFMETTNTSSTAIAFDATKSMRFSTGEFSVDFNSGADNYDNVGTIGATYDEVRYGTSLGDVISAIPEPSQFALGFGFLALCLPFLRRKL